MIVVADTSPIVYLLLIDHIALLPHFYGSILIPPGVWEELEDKRSPEIVRKWVANSPAWLERRAIGREPDPSLDFLDKGEREAIALAEELNAGRLIADETEARAEALRRNIAVIGTLGVLRDGARAGLIDLRERGVYEAGADELLCIAAPDPLISGRGSSATQTSPMNRITPAPPTPAHPAHRRHRCGRLPRASSDR